ncbi:MAG: PCRF domain-containing protein, partial [Nitrospirae bacterium]|nr:PCRF domain-containing protein [Nitrospirota bacterium]
MNVIYKCSASAWPRSGGTFDINGRKARIAHLNQAAAASEFWKSPEDAQKVLKEKREHEDLLARWEKLERTREDLDVLIALGEEEGEEGILSELQAGLKELRQDLERLEVETLLKGEQDRSGAIVTIHSGAGGTESQDWAQMLLRLYLRWAERRGFKAMVVDQQ